MDYGWLGSAERPLDHASGISVIQMGARPYLPSVGRFLSVDRVEGGCANDYMYVHGDPINTEDLEGIAADPLHPCAGTNISQGGARLTITEVDRNDAEGWVRYNINWEAEGKYARKANYTTLNVTGRRPGMKTPTLLAKIDSRKRDATRAQSMPYYAHTTQTLQIGTELRLNGDIDYFLPWYRFGVTGVSVIGTCRA
jgi:RHS repeat-associated protein